MHQIFQTLISYSNFTNNSAIHGMAWHGGIVFSRIVNSFNYVQNNTIGIIASMFESNAAYYGAEHKACRCEPYPKHACF